MPLVYMLSSNDRDINSRATQPTWDSNAKKTIGFLSLVGFTETSFLSYMKLFSPDGVSALCGTHGGCSDVLSGPYSSFLGVPLTIPAMFAYGMIALLTLSPFLLKASPKNNSSSAELAQDLKFDNIGRSTVLVITTAMATCSAYLMALLFFRIQAFCPYCVFSAILSFSMCYLAWKSNVVPEKMRALVTGICTVLITSIASFGFFIVTDYNAYEANSTVTESNRPPPITAESSERSLQLANQLRDKKATMYGAYWCSHCHNQKEQFGAEAFSKMKYVECSPKGWNNQFDICRAKDVPGYPTWEINGKLYPGEKTLEELEEIVSDTYQQNP